MNKSIYIDANNKLENFLDSKISDYSKYRNYDYGEENPHKIVSGLSSYISHGIIKEMDILDRLKKSNKNSEKFKQEILWRTYWKGWLEQNIIVWESYKKKINFYKEYIETKKINSTYYLAINGKTSIKPYNLWVKQLRITGYLHNHARMWFASIWIHYLGLPWELGANFFIENLLDGDIASNTLSWRWVAGIQTKGKAYIAIKANINKYTLNRFTEFDLPKIKERPITEEKRVLNKLNYEIDFNFNKKNKLCIFVLENNLNIKFIEKNRYYISEIIIIRFSLNGINKNKIINEFRDKACEDFSYLCKELNIEVSSFNIERQSTDLIKYLNKKNNKIIITEYIPVSYEKDLILCLKKKLDQSSIYIIELLDPFYTKTWSYCNKGYFNFKKNFDKFNS